MFHNFSFPKIVPGHKFVCFKRHRKPDRALGGIFSFRGEAMNTADTTLKLMKCYSELEEE
jgi:hypothetical protein